MLRGGRVWVADKGVDSRSRGMFEESLNDCRTLCAGRTGDKDVSRHRVSDEGYLISVERSEAHEVL